MAHRIFSAVVLVSLLIVSSLVAASALAQSDPPEGSALTPEQQKQQAKEDRIGEYIRKKEQKRAEREITRLEREAEKARALELENQQLAEQAAAAEAGAAAAVAAAPPPETSRSEGLPPLPRSLAEAQAAMRLTPMGEEPTVVAYLDMIDRREASPQQLAAFGSFIAENGGNRLALIYYDVAIKLDKNDPAIWVNLGTLYRQLGDFDKAKSAFGRALAINPADSVAHYNLGAIYDTQGKYKSALERYRIALTLDPTLGDPAYNPSAANNERLLAVKLMLYQDQAGNIGLPLVDVTGGDIDGITPSLGGRSEE
jgi:tetratricopeptide (TPR) repeat protein